MDYAKEEKENAKLKATYKWQWDKIKELAEDTNIHRRLEKESGYEEDE